MSRNTPPVRAVPRDEHGQLLFDVFAQDCPSRHAMEHVTGRWGLLALLALRDGPARFNALRRRVDGVSEKMLSQTLHALERDGFVDRHARATIPPRVDYNLTPLGKEISNRLFQLVNQLEGRMPAILAAQQHYDQARSGS
jgi:DNA-binding HxlR family transcriptional regulator